MDDKNSWWRRHHQKILYLEWCLTGVFLCLSGYFLWLLISTPLPDPGTGMAVPDQEMFRTRLRSLEPPAPDPAWKVEAQPGRWRAIVVHHSATKGGSVVAIDRFHREERKMENGMGYHFLIGNGNGMPDGAVEPGPRWLQQLDGAHTKKDKTNTYAIGICLVGDFTNTLPTERQLASLRSLLAFLRKEYSIGLAAITGHNAIMATECPGRCFYMDEVILALANP